MGRIDYQIKPEPLDHSQLAVQTRSTQVYTIPVEIEIAGGREQQWKTFLDLLGEAIGDAVEEFMIETPAPDGAWFIDVKKLQGQSRKMARILSRKHERPKL